MRARLEARRLLEDEGLIGEGHLGDAGVRVGRDHEGEVAQNRQPPHRNVDRAIAPGRDVGPERAGVQAVATQDPDDAFPVGSGERVEAALVDRRVRGRLPEDDSVGEDLVARRQAPVTVAIDEDGAGPRGPHTA